MKKWKTSHIILFLISISAILYYQFLTMRYGSLTFINLFLYGGCLLILTICLLHYFRITITEVIGKRWMRICQGVLLVSAILFTAVEGSIIHSGYHETDSKGDTILVLGAGLIGGDRLSLCLLYRLQRAYEEYKQNPDTMIVVSGGQGVDETISEAAAMKQWLLARGVDEAHILVEDRSRNTSENFRFSKEVMKEHGIVSDEISLITNRFHMKRAAYLAERNGFYVHPKPAEDLEYAQVCYYTREFFGLMRAYLLHY